MTSEREAAIRAGALAFPSANARVRELLEALDAERAKSATMREALNAIQRSYGIDDMAWVLAIMDWVLAITALEATDE